MTFMGTMKILCQSLGKCIFFVQVNVYWPEILTQFLYRCYLTYLEFQTLCFYFKFQYLQYFAFDVYIFYPLLPGEIKLEMPPLDLETDLNQFTSDPMIMEMLEHSVMNWQVQITSAIEEQLSKMPQVPELHPSCDIFIFTLLSSFQPFFKMSSSEYIKLEISALLY